jgi:uroporphyrinogen decarboxylase
MYPEFSRSAGVDAVALDTSVPLDWARREMSPAKRGATRSSDGPGVALQGNLDPLLMIVGGTALSSAAKRIVEQMQGVPHVFNLGHGITPEADPGNVEALLRAIRG